MTYSAVRALQGRGGVTIVEKDRIRIKQLLPRFIVSCLQRIDGAFTTG
jgi:hypothetical protein